jgi:hypothetical protein
LREHLKENNQAVSVAPLVNKSYLLEKFPGKGGWTYAALPEIRQNKSNPFGWIRVKGTIDGYAIQRYHLMPMGNGLLFLPVKAEIRNKIKKQAGDKVHVILFADNDPLEIPEELLACLQDEPAAYSYFQSLNESEQEKWVKWIYEAKTASTRIERINKSIQLLAVNKSPFNPTNTI